MFQRNLAVLCFFLAIAPAFHAMACVSISQGTDWGAIKMEMGKTAYLSTRVYNSSAAGYYCDPATYQIEATMASLDFRMEDIFDVNVSPPSFDLQDSENRQVLVALTPKVQNGKYDLLITAKRGNPGMGGTQIFSTASAALTAVVGNGTDPRYSDIPFWTVRKDCPGGFVVRQGEECPRICDDGRTADSEGKCPEDSAGKLSPGAGGNENQAPGGIERLIPVLPMEIILIGILVVVVLGAALVGMFLYVRKLKQEIGGGRRLHR